MVIHFDENGMVHLKRDELESLLAEAYSLGAKGEPMDYQTKKSINKIDAKGIKFRATVNEQ